MYVVYSDRHRLHPTDRPMPGYGRDYPETPNRAELIRSAVEAAQFGPPESPTDFGMGPIEAVHSAGLLEHLRTAYAASRGDMAGKEPYIPHTFAVRGRRPGGDGHPGAFGAWAYDTGCPLFEKTFEASYWSTQAALTAAEYVRSNGGVAYALIRPPGHHAGPDFHGGFCYTNHSAVAARYLQQQSRGRVAILDIDYHHGNGSQEVFYADPAVFFASLHADPEVDYPFYWGSADERGEGKAKGTNLNVPLPHGTDDEAYLIALDGVLPAVREFAPKYLVLSAGFDLMRGDPVPRGGGFRITAKGLRQIAERAAGLGLPTVIVQEGGYNLDKLGEYAVMLLRGFS
ncbi:MAG TPA: histone deacetylase family protein [Fimbriiglobus sp.]|nr:histone deacetylase family protein [Fimbriiglobus sp.]